MKNLDKYLGICILALLVLSCNNQAKAPLNIETDATVINQNPVRSILTAEEQLKMSPDEIIGRLKKGMRIL